MTKKKKVKKKVKKIDHIKNNSKFIQDILDKPLEDYSKNAEYTFTDKLKDYGRNALIIMFVAFFFLEDGFHLVCMTNTQYRKTKLILNGQML